MYSFKWKAWFVIVSLQQATHINTETWQQTELQHMAEVSSAQQTSLQAFMLIPVVSVASLPELLMASQSRSGCSCTRH
jgi:hypothetical protein